MKGGKTLQLLEAIAETGIRSLELAQVILESGYRASHGKLEWELQKKLNTREKRKREKESAKRYYSLLYKLRRDGLIKKDSDQMLHITAFGKQVVERLQARMRRDLPNTHYSAQASNRFIIVAFDIPETERKKRDWLREVLKTLNLTMVQKSLWIGKMKLPQNLIDDLHRVRLMDCVEIFEITKSGSLKHII
jgi:CRISPR/Cas system-associated endoribonuclease Cas2